MTKQGGLGDNLYIGGYDLSGDVQSLGGISSPVALSDMTSIDLSAFERIHALKDGQLEATTFFNDTAGRAHPVLSALPRTDVGVMYCRGTTLGSPAACMVSKQINYDGSRTNDGSFTFGVQAQANGFGLEWGRQLTAGKRTDTTGTSPATGVDTLASASFGAQAYLQVFAFTGTSFTAKIQGSSDNSSFSDLSPSLTFAAASAIGTQRVAVANNTVVPRYLRVITSGTFSQAVFSVVVVKNEAAGIVF